LETNYNLIGKNKKPITEVDYEKVPETSVILYSILEADYMWWKARGHIQLGIERNNLIKKISEKIKVNSNVIYLAIEELILEQKIISFEDGTFTRYIKGL
jgi:hypothetical protein